MTLYSADTGDVIGTTTYTDNGRPGYRATVAGTSRSFPTRSGAVAWLNARYDRTH